MSEPTRSFFSRPGDESDEESDDDSVANVILQDVPESFGISDASSLSNSIRMASRLSISNRLHSINTDVAFVRSVADAYGLPLIANERCGGWYVPPELKGGSCYFKSTDGHHGFWSFSKKRLNLNVLDVIQEHGGCIIVDSTRRGKSMPDALSKTVPIWCAVLNTLAEGECTTELKLPPSVVSASEASQMRKMIPGFVQSFKDLELLHLYTELKKPLRPLWVTPSSTLPCSPSFSDFYPVILLTASSRDNQGEAHRVSTHGSVGYTYIQGAGDDSEGWARGLTSQQFWDHKEDLLGAAERDLPELIATIQQDSGNERSLVDWTIFKRTRNKLAVGTVASVIQLMSTDSIGSLINCTNTSIKGTIPILDLPLDPGKRGNKILRQDLGKAILFARKHLNNNIDGPLVVACETGNDHSVGIALSIIAMFFEEDGSYSVGQIQIKDTSAMQVSDFTPHRRIDKPLLSKRLGWIVSERTQANPSRSTLQAINSWLMKV